jgi:hypothetical protein
MRPSDIAMTTTAFVGLAIGRLRRKSREPTGYTRRIAALSGRADKHQHHTAPRLTGAVPGRGPALGYGRPIYKVT